MLNRIYTRSEEAIWKQKGLLRPARSHRQGVLAIASKEYIESLRCYSEVRRLLAAGKKPRDVAIFIQQHNELPALNFGTIRKYAQVYALFFIPPLEPVRSLAAEPRRVKHRLGDRIYTRAEKEAFWKQKGLLRPARSHRQGVLAIAAKDYIERLSCYSEVRRRLAVGKKPREVAIFIQQHNELPALNFGTIRKYAQVYRLFFITPLETLRTQAQGGGPLALTKYQLDRILNVINEIVELGKLKDLQAERIRDQLEKEKRQGVLLPGVRGEMETQLKIVSSLIDKKFELGLYPRTPQDSRRQYLADLIEKLSADERKKVVEVTKKILAIIEKTSGVIFVKKYGEKSSRG